MTIPTTLQEIFDKVVSGVMAQDDLSFELNEKGKVDCLYRGPNGRKCAAGQILDDADVQENVSFWALDVTLQMPRSVRDLVGTLQQDAHDKAARAGIDAENRKALFLEFANRIARSHKLKEFQL